MGTLDLESERSCLEIYLLLGLKESGKETRRKPNVLSYLSLFLERSVEKNEELLKATHVKDDTTAFHGSEAPALGIRPYIDRIFKFYNNAYYARVGGIQTSEINKLEMKFLFGLEFRLHVSLDTFAKYCSLLLQEGNGELQIERSLRACRIQENWSKKDESSCPTAEDKSVH